MTRILRRHATRPFLLTLLLRHPAAAAAAETVNLRVRSPQMAQPALALSLVQELGLAPAVYNPPRHLVPSPPEEGIDWARGAAVARAVASLLAFRSSTSEIVLQDDTGRLERDAATGEVASLPAAGVVEHAEGETPGKGTGTGEAAEPQEGREASPHGIGRAASCASKGVHEGSDGRARVEQTPETLVREMYLCAALVALTGVKHKAKKGKLVSAPQSIVAESLKVRLCKERNFQQPKGYRTTFWCDAGIEGVFCRSSMVLALFLTSIGPAP